MTTTRIQSAGVVVGALLLIAAVATADDGASVQIHVAYPDPVVTFAGDTVELAVSVVGVVGWQSCAVSLHAESEAACGQFRADFSCDGGAWDPLDRRCDLSLCSCVAAAQNELVVAPPLSIHVNGAGAPDCAVIPESWEGTFAVTSGEAGERLQADLPGDFGHAGVPMQFDSRGLYSATLYTCRIDIAADAEVGVYALPCALPATSDPSQAPNLTSCVDGAIEIVTRPSPTPTSTPLPTSTPTRKSGNDDGGCAIVTPTAAGTTWWLAAPALALLWLRRRAR